VRIRLALHEAKNEAEAVPVYYEAEAENLTVIESSMNANFLLLKPNCFFTLPFQRLSEAFLRRNSLTVQLRAAGTFVMNSLQLTK